MALTTTNATGAQTQTQSPQSAGSATTGTQSSSIQPGTAAGALTSTGGVPLQNTALSVVPLSTQSTGATQTTPVQHHTNPVLTGVSIVLFLVSVVLFSLLARDDKTTTE
ncbi:MAG: hypothetical protein JWO41_234 [Candidatus Saccharibacteria bacterium]|nr:hypothetical protein [Candidatus Saccharibacteria bacterium]